MSCEHDEIIVRMGIPQCSECGATMVIADGTIISNRRATPTDGAGEPGSRADLREAAQRACDTWRLWEITRGNPREVLDLAEHHRHAMLDLGHVLSIPSAPLAATPSTPHPKLEWTREKPKVPGCYWFRWNNEAAGTVYAVRYVNGELYFMYDLTPISKLKECEWAGPIPEPGAEPGALPTGGGT